MTGHTADTPAGDLPCREVVEAMTEYLEGAVPAAEARRLEEHVATCRGCSEYGDQMRTLAGSLAGLAEESIPAQMRGDLIAGFRRLRRG